MGAGGLLDIKRRIKSVESTRKITNAMGLVATSKMRKARKEFNKNAGFIDSIEPIIKNLAVSIPENDSIYFNKNKAEAKLFVVITSDTGLCGGFNANVANYLGTLTAKEEAEPQVIVIGKRGINYVKRLGIEPVSELVNISDIPTVKDAKEIFEAALNLYKAEEVNEIDLVYCDFVSPVKQIPTCTKILPIEKDEDSEAEEVLIEPDAETVLKASLDIYLKAKIRGILLSSKCSEQSSRMTAMDGATSNANDLLDNLNIKYNRIRQSIITQEITEIVGGAEAQK